MRANGVTRIAFSSTGSIYGEAHGVPDAGGRAVPMQTSLYGASKLAGEGLIRPTAKASASRAASSASSRSSASATRTATCSTSTSSLRDDPHALRVLGNGKQRKSYLYVQDCIDAILLAIERGRGHASTSSTSAPTSTARSTTRSAGSASALGRQPALRLHRRRARLDRRQPVHLSRHRQDPRRSAGRRSCRSARASSGRSTTCRRIPGCSRRAHERLRARPLASRAR